MVSVGKFSVSLLDLIAIIVQWGIIGALVEKVWRRFRNKGEVVNNN